jgi:hypothetical protein
MHFVVYHLNNLGLDFDIPLHVIQPIKVLQVYYLSLHLRYLLL